MPSTSLPRGRLPAGVTRGLWDYVHSKPIASDYDAFFASNRLFQFDKQIILQELNQNRLAPGSIVADLGCGTGRAVVALAEQGYRGLAVDLSSGMLEIVHEKAKERGLSIDCVQANLVQLDCVQDRSVDAAVCLFSTVGMIRGRANRHRALSHIHRILRPNGTFVLHVHNYWYNLYDPGGPWWVLAGYARALFDDQLEPGDKFFSYRGIPNMFLHVFSHCEIQRDLRQAGFRIDRVISLDPRRHRELRWPRLLGPLRANGWILVASAKTLSRG
jgi:ubiquinone/menaquinone biosynthesis C-methylase UbiE